MTSRSDIAEWFDEAPTGSTHMVVWCDTFDYGDYPEYINMDAEQARAYIDSKNGKNMRRLMEVYNLRLDKSVQLSKPRVFNY